MNDRTFYPNPRKREKRHRPKIQLLANWPWHLVCLTWTRPEHPPRQQMSLKRLAADAEIKVPFVENTELKGSPFKAWSRSVYSHVCYAYCQEYLPCYFLPTRSIHLHFLQNLSRVFPVLAVVTTSTCAGPQNKIGHPACHYRQLMPVLCWVPTQYT